MNSRILRWALALTVASFGIKVFAHARLKTTGTLVPRSTNPGIKIGPCGGIARTATPAVFAPGATITVNWEETIDHPGRYEFYFSAANDAGFTLLKTVPDTATGALPHQFTTTLTLPNVSCTDCTLQMIQVMTENPANPSYYYSCADIQTMAVTGTPAPTPIPAPMPAPAPAPGPNPTCKPE